MKKFFKITLVNTIFIVISILLIEFIALFTIYREEIYHIKNEKLNMPTNFSFWFQNLSQKYMQDSYFDLEEFRPIVGQEYSNPGILLLGCSFTYGEKLEINQTFQYKLSHLTKRPVYNLGLSAASIREMLYILRNDDIRQKLLPDDSNIDYVIYTYIFDQIPRLYGDVYRNPSPLFLPTENFSKLEFRETKNTFKRTYINFLISRHFAFMAKQEPAFKLLRLYLTETKKEIDKLYTKKDKTPKFVLFVYHQKYNFDWVKLYQDGIIVINADKLVDIDLMSQEYRILNDPHPNEKAWEVIVPALVKELDL